MGFLNGFIGGGSGTGINIKFKWIEEKTVNSGTKTLTLTTTVLADDVLMIFDTKYGVQWYNPANFSRSGQTITFVTNMPENLTFKIYCLEKA